MPNADFICLANSYKLDHRCVAGIRTGGGGWLRPVSAREHGELDYRQYRLPDRSEPRLMDVLRVGLTERQPSRHQPENWRIGGAPWELISRPASKDLAPVVARAVSREPLLFGSYERFVPEANYLAQAAKASLVLVQPSLIRWRVCVNRADQVRKARASFRLNGIEYDLPLTDPVYASRLKGLEPGEHSSSELSMPEGRRVLFTISISEPFEGNCYKLVAAVVVLPAEWKPLF